MLGEGDRGPIPRAFLTDPPAALSFCRISWLSTNAQKFSSLYARNEKEISLMSDRVQHALNFVSIARSRRPVLGAIVRDRRGFAS